MALPVARQLIGARALEVLRDSCHPTEMGHGLYGQTIADSLTVVRYRPATGSRRSLPPALTGRSSAAADDAGVANLRAGRRAYRSLENRGGWQCFDGVESTSPARRQNSPSRADYWAVLLLGPETGDMRMAIDDQPWQPLRMGRVRGPFWRPYRILADDLGPGPHRLRIQVAEEVAPQSQEMDQAGLSAVRGERGVGNERAARYVHTNLVPDCISWRNSTQVFGCDRTT